MDPSGIDISGENQILKIESDKITGDLNIDGNIEISGNFGTDFLHINTPTNPKIRLSDNRTSGLNGYLQFCTNGPSVEYGQGQYTDVQIVGNEHLISFESQKNNETKVDMLRLHADGRVAIGTTNTTEKLEVDGIIKVPQNNLRDGDNIGGAIPPGGIIMWNSNSIPAGWLICDGSNGTPNLTNRFIMAGTTSQVGFEGGSNEKTLQINHMPSHTHNATTSEEGGHTHTIDDSTLDLKYFGGPNTNDGGSADIMRWPSNNYATIPGSNHTHTMNPKGEHTHTVTIEPAGSGDAFDIRPAYYILVFIMKSPTPN